MRASISVKRPQLFRKLSGKIEEEEERKPHFLLFQKLPHSCSQLPPLPLLFLLPPTASPSLHDLLELQCHSRLLPPSPSSSPTKLATHGPFSRLFFFSLLLPLPRRASTSLSSSTASVSSLAAASPSSSSPRLLLASTAVTPALFILPLLSLLAVCSDSVDFLAVRLPLLLLHCCCGRRRNQRRRILASAHLYLLLLLPSTTAAIPPSATTGAFFPCFLHGIFFTDAECRCGLLAALFFPPTRRRPPLLSLSLALPSCCRRRSPPPSSSLCTTADVALLPLAATPLSLLSSTSVPSFLCTIADFAVAASSAHGFSVHRRFACHPHGKPSPLSSWYSAGIGSGLALMGHLGERTNGPGSLG